MKVLTLQSEQSEDVVVLAVFLDDASDKTIKQQILEDINKWLCPPDRTAILIQRDVECSTDEFDVFRVYEHDCVYDCDNVYVVTNDVKFVA